MKKLNKIFNVIFIYVNIALILMYCILISIWNKFKAEYIHVPEYTIDLNNLNHALVKFKLKEINYDNIKGIVIDSFHSGSDGYRYMHIYNNKGQLIISLGWLIEILSNDDNLFLLCNIIKDNCYTYTVKTKPWWWLSNDVFYMHITNKNLED